MRVFSQAPKPIQAHAEEAKDDYGRDLGQKPNPTVFAERIPKWRRRRSLSGLSRLFFQHRNHGISQGGDYEEQADHQQK
jgi:hypothetical protein